jgi:hypothetical protein
MSLFPILGDPNWSAFTPYSITIASTGQLKAIAPGNEIVVVRHGKVMVFVSSIWYFGILLALDGLFNQDGDKFYLVLSIQVSSIANLALVWKETWRFKKDWLFLKFPDCVRQIFHICTFFFFSIQLWQFIFSNRDVVQNWPFSAGRPLCPKAWICTLYYEQIYAAMMSSAQLVGWESWCAMPLGLPLLHWFMLKRSKTGD